MALLINGTLLQQLPHCPPTTSNISPNTFHHPPSPRSLRHCNPPFLQYIHQSANMHARLASKLGSAPHAALPKEVTWFPNMPHPIQWNAATAADQEGMSVPVMMEAAKNVSALEF